MSSRSPAAWRVFWGLLERDLLIVRVQLPAILAQVLMQPVLMLLVFGKVLGVLGYTPPGYAQLLFPGLIALNAFFAAAQNASFPLATEFATRTIETKLAAPIPLPWIVAERTVAAAARGILTAMAVVPIGAVILTNLSWKTSGIPMALLFTTLGALTGAAVGVTIGSLVRPATLGITFSLLMPPLLFTGAAQFPFPELSPIPWFQTLCALNPMTYVSEGLRSALTPQTPHLPPWKTLTALTTNLLLFTTLSQKTFKKRALT